MERVALSPWTWLVLGGALLALGAWLQRRIARARARREGRVANLRGQRGERDAERLLRASGYATTGRHVRGSYFVQVGAERVEIALQADFLVRHGGRRLVAEVKTGRNAPRFEHAETRRQLLEYQVAFGVDSVLLVDVEAGQLREIRFPLGQEGPRVSSGRGGLMLLALGLLGAVAYAVLRRQ